MSGQTTRSNSCECDSNAYTGLVRDIFRVCAYSPIEYVGFLSGLCSIAFWIVCQFPQMLQNYQLKTSEGLSGYFLLLWAFGDSCNLVACVLTGDQTPVQMYTAVYFLMSDSVLISQFVLYRKRQIQREERQTRRRRRLSFNESIIREEEESPEDANENAVISATMARIDENISTARSYEEESRNDPTTPKRTTKKHKKKKKPVSPSTYVTGFLGAGVSVYSIRSLSGSDAMRSLSGATRSLQSATGCLNQAVSTASEARVTSGRFIGYASATSYLGGRVFQIMKNRKRKSCEGVSALMFFFAISANVTYGMSIIFMKNFRWVEIVDSLSFLLGSLGTCVLDLYILKQSRYYRALGTDASATTAPVDRTSSLIENDWLEREASVHLLSQEAVEDL
jgi:solute carrier family 66 (lysosomal lysine-arginine transporter), member 1